MTCYLEGVGKEVLLETESMQVTLENCPPDEWFKLNPGFVGYYQVKYSPADLLLLKKAIESGSLSEVDRYEINFQLFRENLSTYFDFLLFSG